MELTSRSILAILSKVKARVRVAETYFLTKGLLELGVYTDSDGRCRRMKFREQKSTALILAEMARNSMHGSLANKRICFCYIRKTRSCLTSDDIETLLTKQRSLPFTCLQAYLEPRAGSDQTMTISISLKDNSYVSTYSQITGVKPLAELQLQQKMMETAKAVMHRIQEVERKHVEKLELEFIHDYDKRLWLVNINDCRLAVKIVRKHVGMSRSIVSFESSGEMLVPQITIHKADASSAVLLANPPPVIQEPNLPLITRIYQQLKERPSLQKRRNLRSMSSIDPNTPNKDEGPLDNFVSFLAKTINIQDSAEEGEQASMSAAFKDFLSKYMKRDSNELVIGTTVSEIDLSPKLLSPANSDATATDTEMQVRKNTRKMMTLPSQRSLSYNKQVKSISQLHTNRESRRSISIHAAENQANRLDKVMERLSARHEELNRKYGSTIRLPKTVVHAPPLKQAVLSPYATIGIKILSK
mmetsp:Transcript_21152/g.39063  ORF Transcript_21152/g.39063 Transcript_21152/m.39063 type:complete len:472 (-) Transcript_21152:12-1427(-)